MNLSPKLRYFLSYLCYSLLLIIALYLGYELSLAHILQERRSGDTALCLALVAIFLSTCWRHFILMSRLGFPSHQILQKLKSESEKNGLSTANDDPLLKPYLEAMTRGKSSQQIEQYKKSLPFCTIMASPRTQRTLQCLLLAGVLCLAVLAWSGPKIVPLIAATLVFLVLGSFFQKGEETALLFDPNPALEVREGGKQLLVSLDALLLLAGFIALGHFVFSHGMAYVLKCFLSFILLAPLIFLVLALLLWAITIQRKIGRLPYASLVKLMAYDTKVKNSNRKREKMEVDNPEIAALWHQHQQALSKYKGELPYCAFLLSPTLRKGLYNCTLALLLFIMQHSDYVNARLLDGASIAFLALGLFRFYQELRNIFGLKGDS